MVGMLTFYLALEHHCVVLVWLEEERECWVSVKEMVKHHISGIHFHYCLVNNSLIPWQSLGINGDSRALIYSYFNLSFFFFQITLPVCCIKAHTMVVPKECVCPALQQCCHLGQSWRLHSGSSTHMCCCTPVHCLTWSINKYILFTLLKYNDMA